MQAGKVCPKDLRTEAVAGFGVVPATMLKMYVTRRASLWENASVANQHASCLEFEFIHMQAKTRDMLERNEKLH